MLSAYALGREIGRATASEDGGHAYVGLLRRDADAGLEAVVDDLAILMAGPEIERRSLGPHCDPSGDRERAWQLALSACATRREAEALFELGTAKAAALLDRPAAVEAVARLTDALLDRGQLEASEIVDIIEGRPDDGQT